MIVECSFCGKKLVRSNYQASIWEHHYCCRKHNDQSKTAISKTKLDKLKMDYATALVIISEQKKEIENLRKDKREIKLILETIFRDDFVL